jgi:hypothetical protein
MRILSRTGKVLAGMSEFDESEVLFRSGTTFVVSSVRSERRNGITFVTVEMVER